MNPVQELWWRQSKSDLQTFELLNRHQADPCHLLHYLQMGTEKIAKAYFGEVDGPRFGHAVFVSFLRSLASLRGASQRAVIEALEFRSPNAFTAWLHGAYPLAYELERLAPALAGDGPNPEYPWPRGRPVACPCDFRFPIWDRVSETATGRQFLLMLERLVDRLDRYG